MVPQCPLYPMFTAHDVTHQPWMYLECCNKIKKLKKGKWLGLRLTGSCYCITASSYLDDGVLNN